MPDIDRARFGAEGGRNLMRPSNGRTSYAENPDSIEGKWLTLVPQEASDREGLTAADLDQIVREYGAREEAGKAPVVLGTHSQARQEPVARIDEVRRKGDSLEGKFGAVDPRVDYLHGRGVFAKKSVRVKRSPDGVSLDSVGLIQPTVYAGSPHDNETPSLDELMRKHTGVEDYVYGELPMEHFSDGWIEIFKAGDYTKQGKRKITPEELLTVVRNYDSSQHEAPICVGHPADDAPAFGWIEKIALRGDTLLAKEKQVNPGFADARRAGAYKKRSAAFYQDANGNPVGLRHVGYLGAQPPAVKGLRDVAFDDHSRAFVEISFDPAADAVSHLKERGRWCDRFDRQGLPLLFAETAGTPAFKAFVCFVESLVDRFDPMGELFYECARYLARERKITFKEALMEVGNPHLGPYVMAGPHPDARGGAWGAPISLKQRQMERQDSLRALKNHVLPAEIVDLAWRRAEAKGWPFKQALLEVTAERPDIMEAFQDAQRRSGDVVVSK